MKTLRVILIVWDVLLLLLFIFPPIVESRSLARAMVAYHNEASPRNERELERQQAIVHQERTTERLVIGVLLTANTVGLIFVSRRIGMRPRVLASPLTSLNGGG